MFKPGDTVRYKGGSCDTWIKHGAIGIVVSVNDGGVWAAWDKTVNPDEKVWGATIDDIEWISSGTPIPSDPPDTRGKKGIKFDSEKPPLSILTKESLIAEARAFEYGAKKYNRNNYKLGMDWSRIIDATLRHLISFNNKEDFDDESKLNHLWHAKACLAMLIYYYENKVGKDDR